MSGNGAGGGRGLSARVSQGLCLSCRMLMEHLTSDLKIVDGAGLQDLGFGCRWAVPAGLMLC